MMGKQSGQEELFYEFRLDDHVPADHLLRRIDQALDFGFVRERLASSYSPMGRPSIDPELMMRMLLVGYLFGIRSERRLCDEVHLNLAYRWYCRLGLAGRVPDHSTFSKNRYGRFRENDVYRLLFEEVVARCMAAGLIAGHDTAVDASIIEADASWEKKLPGDAAPAVLAKRHRVTRPVQQYLDALDAALPTPPDEPEIATPQHISPTDPAAGWSAKPGFSRFAYSTNYMIDTETDCIIDVEASPARFAAEVKATKIMVEQAREQLGLVPERLAADKAYGSAPLLGWLFDQGIEPHIPVIERKDQAKGRFTRDAFTYDRETNSFTCPAGNRLTYRGAHYARRVHAYGARPEDCAGCAMRADCTESAARRLVRMFDEDARDRVRALAATDAYARSRRLRRRIERLFGHLKRTMGLRRLKLRGLSGAAEEFVMAAAAQNLKLLTRPAVSA